MKTAREALILSGLGQHTIMLMIMCVMTVKLGAQREIIREEALQAILMEIGHGKSGETSVAQYTTNKEKYNG